MAHLNSNQRLVRLPMLALVATALSPLAAAQTPTNVPANGWLVWASNRVGLQRQIFLKAAGGTEVIQLTSGGGEFPAWSPDGSWIAYNDPTGRARVARWDKTVDKEVCEGEFFFWMHEGSGKRGLVCGKDDSYDLVDPDSEQRSLLFTKAQFTRLGSEKFHPGGITHDGRYLLAFSGRYDGGFEGDNGVFGNADVGHNSAIALDLLEPDRVYFIGYGCEPTTAPAGPWIYHVRGDKDHATYPDIFRMKIGDLMTRSSYQGEMEHPDSNWGHEYFPRISNDNQWLVYGATTDGCHSHADCDYEIFINGLGAAYDAFERLTYDPGNDTWPSLYVGDLWGGGDGKPGPAAGPRHLKVNSGGGAAVPGWEGDEPYREGGASFVFEGATVDLNGQTDPAPDDLYLSCVHQAHSHSFPVPDGRYRVRLHFFDAREAQRRMDYTIEGQRVLDDFSIADEAGGLGRVLIREFTVEVSDGDGMQIVADPDQGSDAFESGIEIIPLPADAATGQAADGGVAGSSRDAGGPAGVAASPSSSRVSSLDGGCALGRCPAALSPCLICALGLWLSRRRRRA